MKQHPEFDFATTSSRTDGPVECLGMTFENDEARRAYFLERLKEALAELRERLGAIRFTSVDDAFERLRSLRHWPAPSEDWLRQIAERMAELRRKHPDDDLLQLYKHAVGFPKASDEDILRLSDPPYYTACPNPFLEEFVRHYGRPYDPEEEYHREPFAVDVSVGKTDPLYKAHAYHTKVPHLAIVPSILHYTKPGDLVLDGFCGSGMTGVAAQWCGTAPPEYRREIEEEWERNGWGRPEWGARRVILGDLGPAATFIAANYNLPFDVDAFAEAAQRILDEVEEELGWMYETLHTDGKTKGRINYTVWSEVFACPECSGEVIFLEAALDKETKRVSEEIRCPHCQAVASKEQMDLQFETFLDSATGRAERRPKRVPVLINYNVGKARYEKVPDNRDLQLLERIRELPLPPEVPTIEMPDCQMTRVGRMRTTNVRRVHHLFLPRAAHALAALWRRANAEPDRRLRNMLLFFVEQAIWGMSVLNRYKTIMHGRTTSSNVNQYLSGVYYVPSQHSEVSPSYNLDNRVRRLKRHAFSRSYSCSGFACVTTGDCAGIPIPDDSVDYIFTDPPFGENIYYADLNFLVESWHRVLTDPTPEAIVDRAKKKGLQEYQELMRRCFQEYYRVLKPGRWMTMVFSNSSNAVWRAIQEALGTAGFVVADVRTLDKKQGSFRQVTSSAVKQDLVISAYKPTEALTERFRLGSAGEDAVWAFVAEHLRNVPVFVGDSGRAEVVVERTPQMLHDRMVAFFVQRGVAVPISSPDFFAGLAQRFPQRDGMYFLPDQVAEYDRRRRSVRELRQLTLFVTDEATAIQWVRQQLARKPQTFQELQPQFMRELQAWAKHERTIELKEILEQNFLCYDGRGPIPRQIVSWMRQSATLRKQIAELLASGEATESDAGLATRDPQLLREAKDRWYVPDPNKQADLEKLRERALLREFEEYKAFKGRRLKVFRTEAVRAGFKAAYDAKDYQTIVAVARKLPEKVLQEDEKLLMYYDVALMRMGY